MSAETSACEVVQVDGPHEWDIYIGPPIGEGGFELTGGYWAPLRPYPWSRDAAMPPLTRAITYLDTLMRRPGLPAQLQTLRGHRLGCVCAPRLCHGHVLRALLQHGTAPADRRLVVDELRRIAHGAPA